MVNNMNIKRNHYVAPQVEECRLLQGCSLLDTLSYVEVEIDPLKDLGEWQSESSNTNVTE